MNAPTPPSLVAIDVDGTLVDSNHRMTAASKLAVEAAANLGVTIVIASSRSLGGIRHVADALDCETLWASAFQGALIARRRDGIWSTVHDIPIAGKVVDAISSSAQAEGVSVGRQHFDTWQVAALTAEIRREATITAQTPTLTPDITNTCLPVHKLQIIATPEAIPRLHQIRSSLPHEVAGVFSHPNYLEVTHARAEKALAVCRIAESLGIHRNAVAAIGDGDNDLGLFAYAAYSIAMGNATDRLKWRADAVTSDNNSNGLAEAIDAIRSRWGLTLPAAPRCIPGETHLPLPDLDPEPL